MSTSKVLKEILETGCLLISIFYTEKGVRYIQYLKDDAMRMIHIDRSELDANLKLCCVQISRQSLEKMHTIDNTLPILIGWDADFRDPTLICSGVTFFCDVYQDGFIKLSIDQGGYLLEFSASRKRLLNVADKAEVDSIIFSLAGESLLVEGVSVPVSGRKDITLSFHIERQTLLDCLQFLDGDVTYFSFQTTLESPTMLHDGANRYCCTFVDQLCIRVPYVGESHKDGKFSGPLNNKGARKSK